MFAVETNNTEGALTGVREAGKTGKIKIVGYDTSDPIVAALKDGQLHGDVVQYPCGEGAGVETAVAAMTGQVGPAQPDAPIRVRHAGQRQHAQGQAVHLQRQLLMAGSHHRQ